MDLNERTTPGPRNNPIRRNDENDVAAFGACEILVWNHRLGLFSGSRWQHMEDPRIACLSTYLRLKVRLDRSRDAAKSERCPLLRCPCNHSVKD